MTADVLSRLGVDDPGYPAHLEAPGPDDPRAVARQLISDRYMRGATPRLVQWRGGFYRWFLGAWAEVSRDVIRAEVYDYLEPRWHWVPPKADRPPGKAEWKPNRASVTNVVDALESAVLLDPAVEDRSWLSWRPAEQVGPDALRSGWVTDPDAAPVPPKYLIPLRDGAIDRRDRSPIDADPRLFILWSLPITRRDLATAAAPTAWLEFLGTLWPDASDQVAALQEWFGYTVSGRTDLQKMLNIVGPKRSGKGTIARTLTLLVGEANVAGPSLSGLATNFGLASCIGKTLAVIGDARWGIRDQQVVVSRLLGITGEDAIDVDRKNRDVWTGRMSVRIMILSNDLPDLRDSSAALPSRFITLQTTRTFFGVEDLTLESRLAAEMPGILLWALDGLDRLAEQGRFTETAVGREMADTLRRLASPAAVFVEDECLVGPEFTADWDHVFAAWRAWCEDEGHTAIGTRNSLSRNLKSVVYGLSTARAQISGTRTRLAVGLGLRSVCARCQQPISALGQEVTPGFHPDCAASRQPPPTACSTCEAPLYRDDLHRGDALCGGCSTAHQLALA